MPRCLPIETSAACLSCIFTRKPFEVCETSATARAGLGRQRRAVDDQDAALKHLARRLVGVVRVLELLVDELWSPAHDLADVGEAEHRQFAQDLLNRDFGPLGAGSEDFFDASANAALLRGNREMLRGFTDEEAGLLIALLTRLIANLGPARQFLRRGLTGPSVGG